MPVPLFRPAIDAEAIQAVVSCLESGWLTSGPRVRKFEKALAEYVGADFAVALGSCTAALHLALAAIGLKRGEMVLVPTMTFPATVEVVHYFDAVPVMVDSEPETLCMDPAAARRTLEAISAGRSVAGLNPPFGRVRAVIPVHYGGQMVDVDAIRELANEFGLAVIEDAAHAIPAAYRKDAKGPWRSVGTTGDITCFSFYANKCITTGEGGMAVTNSEEWADRIRVMSLHGLSRNAWNRFSSTTRGSWEYEVLTHGFKYNLTDVAAALGLVQLGRADQHWLDRRKVAEHYLSVLQGFSQIELPAELVDRKSSWHLFPIRLRPGGWRIERGQFIEELRQRGIGCSVHWKPLHLHTFYRRKYGYEPGLFPVAEEVWPRLASLPIFPGLTDRETDEVLGAIQDLVHRFGR